MARIEPFLFGWLVAMSFVFPISISASSLLYFPLLALWLLGARWTFQRWPPAWGPVEKSFTVFLVISLISCAAGLRPAHSLRELEKDSYFLITVMLMAVMVLRARAQWLITAFVTGGLFTAAWGVIQYLVGVNQTDNKGGTFIHLPDAVADLPRWTLDQLSMVNGRVVGTRSHPLTYSEGLLWILAFVLSVTVVRARQLSGRRMVMIWLLGGAVIASQSRGPWLAAVLMAGAALLIRHSGRALLVVFVTFAPIAVLFVAPSFRGRAESIIDRTHVSNVERVHMWRAGIAIWKENPLLGVGPGNVKVASVGYQNPEEAKDGGWGHLHSTYINFLVERGALGLLAFFGVISAIFWELLRGYLRGDTETQAMTLAGILGMIGFLAGGITETVYNDTEILMMTFFSLGVCLWYARKSGEPE